MINIDFTPSFCRIESIDIELEEKLFEFLSYHPSGYFFSPKYITYLQAKATRDKMIADAEAKGVSVDENKIRALMHPSRVWDGYIHMYSPSSKRFRSGLLRRVLKFLKEQGEEVEVIDFPERKEFHQNSDTFTLRPYQAECVKVIARERFGILLSPPRSGKTLMFIATVDSEKQFPTVFFCRSVDLAKQTVKRLRQFLPHIKTGMIADGVVDIQDVTVVTVQSVFSAYNKKWEDKSIALEKMVTDKLAVKTLIRKAKIVFYDEVHHAKGDTSKFVLDKCISTNMKIGLSATPFSGNSEDILVEQSVGDVIHKISYSELIKEGYLLKPYIYIYKLPKMVVEGNYQSIYKQAIVDNEFLQGLVKKIVNKLVSLNHSVVIQTEFINHTQLLSKLLGCPSLTGKDTSEKRDELLGKLERKEIMCLVSTLMEEGIDVGSLGYTINIAGGLSSISTFQRMRSITTNEGKKTCGIIDFYHQCEYLKKHSRIRKTLYESEPEFAITMRDVSKLSLEEI
jgi:superfamily II DNA or RNA helicase